MSDHPALSIDDFDGDIMDAIDSASDQGKCTWLTDDSGKRIAAIVPVGVLEDHDRMLREAVAPLRAVQCLNVPHPAHKLPGGGSCAGARASRPGDTGLDTVRVNGDSTQCALCSHNEAAHRVPDSGQGSHAEMDCLMCADGKCRTPAGQRAHETEVAARAGLLSRRHR